MHCIYCGNKTTEVNNSRGSANQVWRRRGCPSCYKAFTTYERPSLYKEVCVTASSNNRKKTAYIRTKLLTSIVVACSHMPRGFERHADSIVSLVEQKFLLPKLGQDISSTDLANAASDFLSRLDKVAYVKYRAAHNLPIED